MNEYMNMANKTKNWLYQFLRKTQKYTETDNVYLAKHGSWLFLGQIISALASFLLAIAFANLLDPVVYGNYKYILSLMGILGIFCLPGMGTAITQAVARGLEGDLAKGFKEKIKFGILGSLASISLGIYYFVQGNTILPIPLLLIAIFLPIMQASQVYGALLVGKKLFPYHIKYLSLSKILSASSIIIGLFLTKNLIWLIAIYIISNTLLNLFFYFFVKSKFKPNKKQDPETLVYGKHLSVIGVISTIANYLDKILIFHYLGAIDLAVYAFATAPPEQIKGLLKNIHSLALPKFAQKTGKEIKKTIFKKMAKFFLILLPIVGFYILIAPFIYKIFFPQYLDSIFYSQIFAVSLLCTPFYFLGITALESQKARKQLYQINICNSLIQIAVLFLFIYFLGLIGAILARVLYRLTVAISTILLIKKIEA